jgi:hypothetical protein
MNKKVKLLTAVLALASTGLYAQKLGLEGAASDFWGEVKAAAPYILAGIFLISVFFNIGKVTGQDRDYKGFLTGVALFFFGIVLVAAIISYLLSLTF